MLVSFHFSTGQYSLGFNHDLIGDPWKHVTYAKEKENTSHSEFEKEKFLSLGRISLELLPTNQGLYRARQPLSLHFQGALNLFRARLRNKLTLFDKACLFQTHRLGILEQRKGFAVGIHDHHLSIKRTKGCRL
jgi:hypothetical protein